ncbi:hypothetical protein FGA82_22060 [Pseudomonas fluorescens]|nr:hypothetical protein [Pseudomonas fluorescens]TMU73956.1 hypothetical protein FGA82_22060 [Pseudomonas fluorescens]
MATLIDGIDWRNKNVLIRHRSQIDGRQIHLTFTEHGQRLVGRLPYNGADAMNELATALTPYELKALEYLLKKILSVARDPITLQRIGPTMSADEPCAANLAGQYPRPTPRPPWPMLTPVHRLSTSPPSTTGTWSERRSTLR